MTSIDYTSEDCRTAATFSLWLNEAPLVLDPEKNVIECKGLFSAMILFFFFSFQRLKRPLSHHFCNCKVVLFLTCCGSVLAWLDQIFHPSPCPPTTLFLPHTMFRTNVTRRMWICLNNYYYSEEVNHCFVTCYLSQDCFHRLIFF